METLKDNLWIWGQDAGCHHAPEVSFWKIPGVNKMQPWDGAQYLGIPNCCRVCFAGQPQPPFDDESKKLTGFKQVVWSALGDKGSLRNNNGADDLDEVLRQAKMFPNITGAVLDDLFCPETKDARVTIERMKEMQQKLHDASPRPLELWIVYYAALFNVDYSSWIEHSDVVTFWSWTSQELAQAEKNLNTIFDMTCGKKLYAGCYLYNYGDNCPLTRDEMNFQLDLYLRFWKEKKIDGIIVCSNTVADVGLEAVDIFRNWNQLHGNETR